MKKTMIPTKDRPTTMISIRMPVDVVEKLKKIAPVKGMSGYQALIKYYVGKGLREDLDLFMEIEAAEKKDSVLAALLRDGTPELIDEINERVLAAAFPANPKGIKKQAPPPVTVKEQEHSTA